VLGPPLGGVPVAYEIASVLGVALDAMNVRKLGFPGHEELALGAVATGGVRVLNTEELRFVSDQEIDDGPAPKLTSRRVDERKEVSPWSSLR
jgi:putative phosphoribosyl transferase